MKAKPVARHPWLWVPSLYVAEGVPYIIAMTVSVVLYKKLGIPNTDIALYTSCFYLPWVIKPLWSPFVDMFYTKRFWIVAMQLLIGLSLTSVAIAIPSPGFFRYTIIFLWIMAFSSATHDIAADGFYMLGLRQYEQAAFVGVRTTFYRIASIAAKGGVVVLAGCLEMRGFSISSSWSLAFFVVAAVWAGLFLYNVLVLPYPAIDKPAPVVASRRMISEFFRIIILFFRKKDIGAVLAFFLFYRFAEAQLVKMVAPFLLDPPARGGLGLTTSEVGIVYGTVGVIALMLGGLLGGYAVYEKGLKYWLWSMVCAMHLPDLIFVYLSYALPHNLLLINFAVAIEQFGYGFGFTAFTMVMILAAEGEYKTVHYAIGTGIMALGMMLPAMFSGWIQEMLGYRHFFLWIVISTIPGFIVTAMIRVDPAFGKKKGAGAK
ncbi:MAG: MFS transporter [Syntrophobacteraceae bacterium CG23_combo_of_CG06-09_8_20_14_all_50_8]|nr:MAG: MFS transporter [Syntrophobacteraceae bacterium CG23_combo_of_CG06-09_8_20_14_all_50_8]